MVQIKKVTLTPADIIAMFAVPQELIPAAPAGYANTIFGVSVDMVFNAAAYTGAASFYFGGTFTGTVAVFKEGLCLPSIVNIIQPVRKYDAANALYTTTKSFGVTTDALAATGDSPIDVYIAWEQKIISP